MNALVAFGDDGAHSQQTRALCRPVARGAGAVFFSSENDERCFAFGILYAGVEDAHLFALGQQAGDAAFGSGSELVAQANVGEGSTDHDFMIAAARAVGVEVGWLDAVLGQVLPCRAVLLDG